MEKPDLIRFMAQACHYAQDHITGWGYEDPNVDREYLLQCTSHQIACFLAQNTVDGSDGVETEIVLEQLVSPEIREIEEWESIFKGIVEEFGGLKDEQ